MDAVEKIARTCLYEGYLLWPYRRTALKNAQRWTFGGVYPRSCADGLGEPSRMRTQVLLEAGPAAKLTVHLRFLQVVDRQVFRHGPSGPVPVDELRVAGERHLTWQEATERRWVCPPWSPRRGPRSSTVDIAAGTDREALRAESGSVAGTLVRGWKRLTGTVRLETEAVTDTVQRVTVEVENTTPCPLPVPGARRARDAAAPYAFASTHAVLHTDTGAFVSLTDPPGELREAAAACRNTGVWPVLVSDDPDAAAVSPHRARDVLSSPITLYDYPAVAPESPGDMFDGGEIDQLLILGILSLTPEEQEEARATDPRAREILDRCAALGPGELSALHGTIRGFRPVLEER
ncbi:hypothetical protein GCM10012287_11700 [Streptomyces daqingensis]|uniref:Hydrogenase maturation protease n=1 Tax=Streptomyces daqingensis TaxID=1472640 RepID=A0ABQ2LYI6_9ACTN|nr:hypothetical protein [Streptomyces daqingensis]GGO44954.1 hypothetical protein GCM10012287_11700 [Streptomyces daqingensis]